MTRKTTMGAVAAFAVAMAGLTAVPAQADETVLQGASCFPQGSFFSQRFEALIDTVNERGKGVVQINYVGGAPAIGSPFTLVQKVAQGVYDLASCTGAYYQNVLPEADAWKLMETPLPEVRQNGGWDMMVKASRDKGLMPIARTFNAVPFHLYLGEGQAIDKPDLTGKHLRVAPIYTNFFKEMGATTQTSNLDQIYTLMENGTVAGYGWPIVGLRPGWEKVTKYRVDPGFYSVDLEVLFNAKVWDGLSQEARDLVQKVALEYEAESLKDDAAAEQASRAKQAGEFEVITFTGADAEKWLTMARNAGWAGVIDTSPETGPALRKLFAKE
ncbi:MAG: hypothetical protein RIB84_20215 [Sneathiellaceae bacterium]